MMKSFTLYIEIFRLIDTIQPVENRDKFIGKLLDFYFKNKKPKFAKDSIEEIIWENISKPIISYKSKVINGSKGGRPKKTESESEKKTTSDVYVDVNVNVNVKEIIEYLNKKIKSNYKANNKQTISKINARLNEGYKLDDFIAVIDKKTNEWLGTEMEKYLRPETLFGTKFESYLNQKIETNKVNPKWFSKENETKEPTTNEIEEMQKILEEIGGDND